MDQRLQERWRKGRAPFDQRIVLPDYFMLVSGLRAVLAKLVDRIEGRYADVPPVLVHDWHEHDGYISAGRQASWGEIRAMLGSDQALYAARPGDTDVRL